MIEYKVKSFWIFSFLQKKNNFVFLLNHFNGKQVYWWDMQVGGCTLNLLMNFYRSDIFFWIKQISKIQSIEWSFLLRSFINMHAPYVWRENKHYHSIVAVVCVVRLCFLSLIQPYNSLLVLTDAILLLLLPILLKDDNIKTIFWESIERKTTTFSYFNFLKIMI
jgi:hypothetical protein